MLSAAGEYVRTVRIVRKFPRSGIIDPLFDGDEDRVSGQQVHVDLSAVPVPEGAARGAHDETGVIGVAGVFAAAAERHDRLLPDVLSDVDDQINAPFVVSCDQLRGLLLRKHDDVRFLKAAVRGGEHDLPGLVDRDIRPDVQYQRNRVSLALVDDLVVARGGLKQEFRIRIVPPVDGRVVTRDIAVGRILRQQPRFVHGASGFDGHVAGFVGQLPVHALDRAGAVVADVFYPGSPGEVLRIRRFDRRGRVNLRPEFQRIRRDKRKARPGSIGSIGDISVAADAIRAVRSISTVRAARDSQVQRLIRSCSGDRGGGFGAGFSGGHRADGKRIGRPGHLRQPKGIVFGADQIAFRIVEFNLPPKAVERCDGTRIRRRVVVRTGDSRAAEDVIFNHRTRPAAVALVQRHAKHHPRSRLARLAPKTHRVGRNGGESNHAGFGNIRRFGLHHQVATAARKDVGGERVDPRFGGSGNRYQLNAVFHPGGQFGTVLRRQDAALRRHQPPGGIDVKCDHYIFTPCFRLRCFDVRSASKNSCNR